MYQALYRKWRPKSFDDVVGQQHITETLKNQVSTGHLSHAYLFIGTRGTGKTTCAKILAKAVNCESPENGNPCNKCRSCLGIDDGSIMDVVEIDAASNNGVDNVRDLRDEAVFSPAMVKKRVYIIDEVHMLSASAFNALLKILEEPPEHLMFILATTELHKVPATILSRCQRHSFKRLDSGSIIGRLQFVASQEGLTLQPEAAALIARLSEGGMRDALSLLDQCSGRSEISAETVYSAMGLAGKLDIAQMLRHIASRDTAGALTLFQRLWQNGKDPSTLLGELSSLMRDILMLSVAPKGGAELISGGYDDESLASFTKLISAGELISGIELIQRALGDMCLGQVKTVCELCLITLCEPELGDGLPALRSRIDRLESALSGDAAPAPAAFTPPPQKAFTPPAQPEPKAPAMQKAPPPAPASSAADDAPFDLTPPPPTDDDIPFDPSYEPAPPPAAPAFTPPSAPSASAYTAPAAPAAPAFAPAAASGAEWESIKAAIGTQVSIGAYAILTDPLQVSAVLEGDTLAVSIKSAFALGMLNKPDIISAISKTAGEICGMPVRVQLREATAVGTGSAPASPDRLDSLSRFDIVKFK